METVLNFVENKVKSMKIKKKEKKGKKFTNVNVQERNIPDLVYHNHAPNEECCKSCPRYGLKI
jgi:hypothetical protein